MTNDDRVVNNFFVYFLVYPKPPSISVKGALLFPSFKFFYWNPWPPESLNPILISYSSDVLINNLYNL